MKISEIMTKNVVAVDVSDSIVEVTQKMTEKKIHGVPVLEAGKLVGIITETDFFTKGKVNVYLPTYVEVLSNEKLFKDASREERQNMAQLLDAKAGDIMTTPCVSLKENDDVVRLLELIKDKNLHTVPVVDENEKLCGVVTRADLIMLVKI